ncbi:MAG: hypothetical protein HYU56_04535 [Candidatus Aenigmarchaeota archaeon]|nr:hypothetical protein [Candidatus Aenigmarchaeota archaeon]
MDNSVQEKIFTTFSSIATSLGYSEVHGRIIAALLVNNNPVSLQELSESTGYSPAAISLSLDLLELVGMIRKIKNAGDRKLYVRLDGDLLEGLRNALLLKLQKEIITTKFEIEKYTEEDGTDAIQKLKKELDRLQQYVDELAKVEIPKRE